MAAAYGAMRPPRTCHITSAAVACAIALAVVAAAAPPPIPGISTTTVTSADTDLPIPDSDALVSVLGVMVAGIIVDVDLTVDITHPQSDQLDVFLVSPSGTTITLTTDNGGANDDVFAGTTFDDQASGTPSAPCVRNFVYTDMVPTGRHPAGGSDGRGRRRARERAVGARRDRRFRRADRRAARLVAHDLDRLRGPPERTDGVLGRRRAIPDNNPSGRVSTIAGLRSRSRALGRRRDARHPPSERDRPRRLPHRAERPPHRPRDGRGGGNDDLYAGTTFDDQAGTPVSDTTLPTSGTAFGAVVPEGALSAFMGEDPNGTWTLTVVDDAGGNTGTLNGWTLRLVTATVCGDGVVDAGEQCDDGNGVDGDGCDSNCTPTGCGNGVVSAGEDCDDGNTADGDGCPSTCRLGESDCGNCVDDDGNGLVDVADPACGAAPLALQSGAITPGPRGRATSPRRSRCRPRRRVTSASSSRTATASSCARSSGQSGSMVAPSSHAVGWGRATRR
jgi:cysteine-rich repeat protein